jgi:hypothetical protein
MDSPRPVLPAELEFFNKGTDKGVLSLVLIVLPLLVLSCMTTSKSNAFHMIGQ